MAHNPRAVKIHRSYTVDEIASLYGIHKNTVRAWIKSGLPTCDSRKPLLVLGSALRGFLEAKRTKNKRPCKPWEIFCMRCRKPQSPALAMADYVPLSATLGNLVGICPVCDALMYRRCSPAKLALVQGCLAVTFPKAQERLGNSTKPTVNSDFSR